MSLTIDGSSLVFDGTVTVTNYSNPAAGLVTLTLTPSGGVGTLPALVEGQPGQPALITDLTVNTLSAGQPATGTLSQTSAGGAGTPSEYTLVLNIPQGAPGTPGTSGTLAGSSDLSGSPAVADIVTVKSLSPTAFQYSSLPLVGVYNPSTINSLSEAGNVTGELCPVSVPALPYNWYPICFGSAVVHGTVNTVVNLEALLNSASSGDLVGIARGAAGTAIQTVSMNSGFGGLVNAVTGYGVVAAGDAATIYLNAVETASTSDNWSIADTDVDFTVIAMPTAAAT